MATRIQFGDFSEEIRGRGRGVIVAAQLAMDVGRIQTYTPTPRNGEYDIKYQKLVKNGPFTYYSDAATYYRPSGLMDPQLFKRQQNENLQELLFRERPEQQPIRSDTPGPSHDDGPREPDNDKDKGPQGPPGRPFRYPSTREPDGRLPKKKSSTGAKKRSNEMNTRDMLTVSEVHNLRKNLRHNTTIGDIFSTYVRKYGYDKDAFVDADTGKQWTFNESEESAYQVANIFAAKKYQKGDMVTLYMTNCPEYVCVWLGLSKFGAVVTIINFNLRAESLGHSLNVANAKSVIVGADLVPALAESVQAGYVTNGRIPVYACGTSLRLPENGLSVKNFTQALSKVSKAAPNVTDPPGFKDVLFYIYTSGTTGPPKAAIITHCRFCVMGSGAHLNFRIRGTYVTMPLYHSAAGISGAAQTLLHGTTRVIRKKPESKFWDDCIQFDCTASQYTGEICQYLLAQPEKQNDRLHKVRLMYGNGLRPQIWQQFVTRFGIKQIGEFYGSTEGNASLLNLDNHLDACGLLPIYPFIRALYPVCLLKVDPETTEVIRNEKGLCVPCRPGESGEIVGRIIKGDPVKDFVGYVSGKDTSKKVIQDVFANGDSAFASGDILYMDERGYLYFRDRTGDTFRWKGENVSTTGVEAVLHKAVGMNDATVYGVEIPNLEGRAGMAAIADENQNVDLEQLQHVLKDKSPAYARPVFLRLCTEVDRTGTYKLKKTELQKAGFDPHHLKGDRLFYLNSKTGQYEPLSVRTIYEAIFKETVSF